MVFGDMMRDTIEVLKANGGQTIPKIRASVQGSKIMIMSPGKLVIDVNDLIRRKLSNGAEETYLVTNPEFSEGSRGSIPPFYRLHVKKLGLPEATKAIQSITFNVTGHNARINTNSVDRSTNVVTDNGDFSRHISELRTAVKEASISDEEESEAGELIDEVESQLKSGKPKASVITGLLNALPKIAAVTNAAASLIHLVRAAS